MPIVALFNICFAKPGACDVGWGLAASLQEYALDINNTLCVKHAEITGNSLILTQKQGPRHRRQRRRPQRRSRQAPPMNLETAAAPRLN